MGAIITVLAILAPPLALLALPFVIAGAVRWARAPRDEGSEEELHRLRHRVTHLERYLHPVADRAAADDRAISDIRRRLPNE